MYDTNLCLSVCLSVCPSVCPSVRPSVCLYVRPSIRPSVRPPVCLSVCLSVCLKHYQTRRKMIYNQSIYLFLYLDSPFIRISKLWTILKWRYDRVNLKCCYFFCSRSEGNQLKRNLKPRFERVKAFKHHCGVIFRFMWFNANKVLMFLFLYHLQKASFWTSNNLLALNAIHFNSIWKITILVSH